MNKWFKACIGGLMLAVTLTIVAAIANIVVMAICYIVNDKDTLFKFLKYLIMGFGFYWIAAGLLNKL